MSRIFEVGDSELLLSPSDIALVDHESRLKELEDDMAALMRREFRLRQRLAVLEGSEEDSSSSPPSRRRRIAGEWGTPYPRMSMCTQKARRTTGPPNEANRERWVGSGSADHPIMLIPIEDVIVTPASPSSEEEGEYHEAPVADEGGITEVSNSELDLAEEKESSN
jgi:hypothetical protein